MERQLQPNASGIIPVDTFQISVETVRIDTPSTKNKPHLIIGKYADPDFGEIYAKAFTHLRFYNFDTLQFGAKDTYGIDSIKFQLYPDFVLGSNTTSNLKIGIHRLAKEIDKDEDYNYLSNISYEEDPLAEFNFPFAAQTIQSITLKEGQGFETTKALFESCNNNSQLDFVKNFKGLAFIPDSSSSTYAFGIRGGNSSGLGVTVYYHLASDTTAPLSYVFGIYDNSTLTTARFTHLSVNGTTDLMKKFHTGELFVLPSSQTGNIGYMNDMLGIRTRISFPGLSSFLAQIKGKYLITEATILMPYTNQSYNQETTRATPALSLIECDPSGIALRNFSDTLYKYKLVQSEQVNGGKGDLNGVDRDFYTGFQNYYKRFYYPFSLYAQSIENEIKPNNPFIPSLSSYVGTTISQSPLGYTFFDQSQTNGIRLLIILNKLN